MKTGIKRERGSNPRVGKGGCLLNTPKKRTSEVGERAGAMVGWAGRAWKTATSHRHRTGQERPSQTDRKNPMYFKHNRALATQIYSSLSLMVDDLTAA